MSYCSRHVLPFPNCQAFFFADFTFAQRALCAAAILLRAAADSVRFFGIVMTFGLPLFAFSLAHRALWAAAILALPAADMLPRVPFCFPYVAPKAESAAAIALTSLVKRSCSFLRSLTTPIRLVIESLAGIVTGGPSMTALGPAIFAIELIAIQMASFIRSGVPSPLRKEYGAGKESLFLDGAQLQIAAQFGFWGGRFQNSLNARVTLRCSPRSSSITFLSCSENFRDCGADSVRVTRKVLLTRAATFLRHPANGCDPKRTATLRPNGFAGQP